MPSDRFHFRAKMPPPPCLSGLWSNLLLWRWGSPLNREQPIITFMPDHRSSSTPTTEKLHFLYFFLERRRKITHRWAGPVTQKVVVVVVATQQEYITLEMLLLPSLEAWLWSIFQRKVPLTSRSTVSGNLQKMLNVPCRQAAGEEDKRPILPAENFTVVFFPSFSVFEVSK